MRRRVERQCRRRRSSTLLFLLVTALSFDHVTAAQAMPLRNGGDDAAAGFLRALDRHDFAGQDSARGTTSPGNAAALDTTALPADAFEHAASRGLASIATGEKTLNLEELIAVAGLGTGLYASPAEEAEAGTVFGAETPEATGGTGITVRNLAHVVVNRADPPEERKGGGGSAPSSGGYSLLNAVMEAQLDADFVETAAKIVTPTVTTDGVIALTFLGLRDFAFIASPVTNKMQIMDFKTGTTITLSHSADGAAFPSQQQSLRPAQDQPGAPRVSVHELVSKAKQFLFGYVLHPFALGALALFSIFWLLLRTARRAS